MNKTVVIFRAGDGFTINIYKKLIKIPTNNNVFVPQRSDEFMEIDKNILMDTIRRIFELDKQEVSND